MSGSAGVVYLSSKATPVPANDPSVVDLVGYGSTATPSRARDLHPV